MTRLALVALACFVAGRRQGLIDGQQQGFKSAAGIFTAGLIKGTTSSKGDHR